jgi:hypothetical protein
MSAKGHALILMARLSGFKANTLVLSLNFQGIGHLLFYPARKYFYNIHIWGCAPIP